MHKNVKGAKIFKPVQIFVNLCHEIASQLPRGSPNEPLSSSFKVLDAQKSEDRSEDSWRILK